MNLRQSRRLPIMNSYGKVRDLSTVLITGASGGLGRAFAHALAQKGHDLLLCSSNLARCGALRDELGVYGVKVECFEADLADEQARDSFWREIDSKGVRIHWIVNVAGTDFEGLFSELCSAKIRKLLRINIEAAVEMSLEALARRDAAAPFRIIFISSLAACQPMPYKALYAASKRFLLQFAIALSEELRDKNATVTAVCPAGIPTSEYWRRSIESQGFWGRVTARTPAFVAEGAIRAALRGKRVWIPGWINVLISRASTVAPPALCARMVERRWSQALKRFEPPDAEKRR